MTTKMKSFRLDEWTAQTIERVADELGVSQASVIALAVQAFDGYGIGRALACQDYKGNDAPAYSALLSMSEHGKSVEYEVRSMIDACARV